MGVVFEDHNGRTYVYMVSSKRIPGKKNPVCRKEYLGILDEEKGLLRPKPIPIDEVTNGFHDGCFRSMNYGGVLLLTKVAENLGIRSDLNETFGEYGGLILAMAISKAIDPTPSKWISERMRGLYLNELVGNNRPITESTIRDTANHVTDDGILEFFKLTRKRHPGHFYIFGSRNKMFGMDMVTYGSLVESMDTGMDLVFTADDEGHLLSTGINIGRKVNVEAYKKYIKLDGSSSDYTVIIRDGTDNPEFIAKILMSHVDVVMICVPKSESLASLALPDVERFKECAERKHYGGREYLVSSFDLKLSSSSGGWRYSLTDETEGLTVRAFVTMDLKLNSTLRRVIKDFLHKGKAALEDPDCDPDSILAYIPGIERLIDMERSGNESSATFRRSYKYLSDRAGMIVILSTSKDWDECIRALQKRRECMNHSRILSEIIFGYGEHAPYRPWKGFIAYLAIMMRLFISNKIKEKCIDISVDDAIHTVSEYTAISEGNSIMFSDKSSRVERIFKLILE